MFRRYLVLLITYGSSFSNISESENYHFQLFFGAGREENKKKNKTTKMHQRTTGSSYFKPVNAPMVFMKEPVFL